MERIWWEKVPNALSFVSDITESLLEEKSIVLQSSAVIPWRSSMESAIKNNVKQQNSSKRFESVRDVEEPREYILKEYCKPEKRAMYRPSKTYADFFANSDDIVLHSCYLWVRVHSRSALEAWTGFVSEYVKKRKKGKEAAVFILEWHSGNNAPAKKGIKIYSFDDYIGEYDRIVFSTLASSSIKEKTFIKNYLAELAAGVIENDMELCAECLARYDRFLADPAGLIIEILRDCVRSDGTEFTFAKTPKSMAHCIWLAQIRTIYSVIEEFRESFVKRHSAAIQAALPIQSAYGEEYTDFRDVELGILVFMVKNDKLCLNSSEYAQLKKYREARNRLSHLSTLNFDEIQQLCM